MLQYDINLAHGVIWSRKRRLLIYRLLVLYLAIMALFILGFAIDSTRRVVSGLDYMNRSAELAEAFLQTHPGEKNLHTYANSLDAQLAEHSKRIVSLTESLPSLIHSPHPALTLLVNQFGNDSLYRLDFTQQTEDDPFKLEFDLIIPLNKNETFTRKLLNAWQNDPYLSVHFPNIKQLKVRRTRLARRTVQITQYEAVVKNE